MLACKFITETGGQQAPDHLPKGRSVPVLRGSVLGGAAASVYSGRERALRKALHPQGPGPKLPRGWGAARSRSRGCGTGMAEIRPTEPGRVRPAKGVRDYRVDTGIVVTPENRRHRRRRHGAEHSLSSG